MQLAGADNTESLQILQKTMLIWADAQDHLPTDAFPSHYCSPHCPYFPLPDEQAHWQAHQLNEFNKGGVGLNRWSLKG